MSIASLQPNVASDEKAQLKEASRALESFVVKQLLTASGAFKMSGSAGASIHADWFVEALADAVSQQGETGLSQAIERSMTQTPEAPKPSAPLGGAPVVTSPFGIRVDPFNGAPKKHLGVDLRAPLGSPIVSAFDGVVRKAGPMGSYGLAVEIEHPNGLTTLYAHASEVLVRPGEQVKAGQCVAKAGSTGRSTGNHLHFEVRQAGVPVDPQKILKAYGQRADSEVRAEAAFAGAPL